MFEGTEKQYRELFNKYIRRPKVDVFPGAKEEDWLLYRKIGNYGIFNPDIKEEDKKATQQIFSDIWNFMEFNEWREHRMALLTILHDHKSPLSIDDFDNLSIHNYELKEKVFADKDMKKAYKKYYGNIFHDFDAEIPKDDE